MSEPKSYASLSSGLLARKGGAKPAMRPQSYTSFNANAEDLGWNDMGGQIAEPFDHVPSSIAALTPAPSARAHGAGNDAQDEPQPHAIPESAPEPVVVEQQRALEQSFQPAEPADSPAIAEGAETSDAAEPAELPAPMAEAPAPRGAVVRLPKRQAVPAPAPAKAKAAFTLRLDPERHLRLRLACALSRKSAQQLVTQALDDFLSTLPEVEQLAGHVPAGQRR